jgi:penicillin amidase
LSSLACVAALALPPAAPLAASPEPARVQLPALSARVQILFDAYDIPHIYAGSAEDAYRALGWLHAGERLWQMELLRRRASGTLAELIGADGLASDELVRRLGIRRSAEEALRSGLVGDDVPRWLAAYAEGVNARLAQLGTEQLPPELKALGIVPAPWTPSDSAAFSKYMGWDQSGSDSDLWLGLMVEKLGAETALELWPLDRPYELTTIPAAGATGAEQRADPNAARGAISADIAALATSRGARLGAPATRTLIARLAAAARDDSGAAFGSNNWVVSGAKTESGKPLLANDPHLGFTLPSLWYTAHLSAPGLHVTGVTFPGQPFVTLGHNADIAWGFTNMQSDAVDYFVETVNPANPKQYRHRGEWKEFEERVETIPVRGAQPVRLVVRSTLHGPVIEAAGKLVAIAWTGLRPTRESLAIARLNRARNLAEFLDAMAVLDTPPMNVAYAGRDGHIAIAPWGDLPIRSRGLGRVPVDGASGDFDWTGLIPREQLPISIDPERGWLASANGRPAPAGYRHHLGWMWDPSYRTRRIHALLSQPRKLSREDMQRFQFDAHDVAAETFTPILLEVMSGVSALSPTELAALAALRDWDYVFTPDTVAGAIWSRWFTRYRAAVWDDEWVSRGIVQPKGSWGYSGDNAREPALEVLEFLTRENPHSIWFDDRTTPLRESRDELIVSAFRAAVADLTQQLGKDVAAWRWGARNRFAAELLSPLAGERAPSVELRGGPFTLNPGGKGGPVASGASWRQVVDFGALGESVGIYPGGQSGDPDDPHALDQLALWAKGEYAPLWFASDPNDLPARAVQRRVTLEPLPPGPEPLELAPAQP